MPDLRYLMRIRLVCTIYVLHINAALVLGRIHDRRLVTIVSVTTWFTVTANRL